MDSAAVIANLEREWDFDRGFFGRLRKGEFDVASLDRLLATLDLVEPQVEREHISRRLTALLWYMPGFMEWQKDRVRQSGGDVAGLEKAINRVRSAVERILGVP